MIGIRWVCQECNYSTHSEENIAWHVEKHHDWDQQRIRVMMSVLNKLQDCMEQYRGVIKLTDELLEGTYRK